MGRKTPKQITDGTRTDLIENENNEFIRNLERGLLAAFVESGKMTPWQYHMAEKKLRRDRGKE